MINTFLSWSGTVALFLDMYLVGKKSRLAWVFCIIGEILWIVYSWRLNLWALMITCFGFLALGIKNWFSWRERGENNETT